MTFTPPITTTLDEAFERLGASGFELPNGFVNHGPMACEALATLGCDDEVDQWARRFARSGGTAAAPTMPTAFEWHEALGDRRRAPEWIGWFEREIEEHGWAQVVQVWVPRLVPGLAAALFHGAIRAGHAVRAIDVSDTAPRRAELARAFGFWASRFSPGAQVDSAGRSAEPSGTDVDLRLAVTRAAADAARHYLARPGIVELHGITGAMAVELFAPHLTRDGLAGALAQVRAEHARIYRSIDPVDLPEPAGTPTADLVVGAYLSRDPHQVKLVEACLRGSSATHDPAFAAAAELVVHGG